MPARKKKPKQAKPSTSWPNVEMLVDRGAVLGINGGGYRVYMASLHEGEELVCMFWCDRMPFAQIMNRLESLAKRYNEEGIVTDAVNGTEHSVW